jgi:uncharacterized delta-60 repeat protein
METVYHVWLAGQETNRNYLWKLGLEGIMRKALSAVAILATLVLATGTAKADAAAHLDSGFGKSGVVTLPDRVVETWRTVQLPDGRIFVPGREGVFGLLPSGRVDTSFGVGGFAAIVLPPGATQASIADLLLDPQGRLIVVGNAGLCTPGEKGCTDQRQAVLVERFDPNGRLDPGFGEGGFVTSDFGVAPPTPVQPTPGVGTPPPPAGQRPSVLSRYAALDPAGRIVLSAQRLAGYQFHKGYSVARYEAFVARLEADGKVDTSFATGGVLSLPGSETLGRPLADSQGGVYVQSFGGAGSILMHLQANGGADPGFGQNGGRPLPADTDSPVLLDRSGRLLLYGYLPGSKERRLANGILIKRLLPGGSLDRGFGRGGAIRFRMPRLYTARITLDERGRILVGAALKEQLGKGRQKAMPAGFALARLRPGGRLDTRFGRRGIVQIPLPRYETDMNLESLGARSGMALMGGGGCGNDGCGRVLVRVALGSD